MIVKLIRSDISISLCFGTIRLESLERGDAANDQLNIRDRVARANFEGPVETRCKMTAEAAQVNARVLRILRTFYRPDHVSSPHQSRSDAPSIIIFGNYCAHPRIFSCNRSRSKTFFVSRHARRNAGLEQSLRS